MAGMTRKNFHVCQRSLRVAPGQYTTRSMRTGTDTYEHLKAAILQRLCPDTEEDRLVAREKLSRRRLREGESIDELARDVEKLLDQASPGLPEELRESELRFNLINALPEKVSFQLKLQPKRSYVETIARGKELFLISTAGQRLRNMSIKFKLKMINSYRG